MTTSPPLFEHDTPPLPQPAAIAVCPPLVIVPVAELLPEVVIAAFEIGTHEHAWRDFARDLKRLPRCLDYRKATPAEIEKLLRRRKPR